MSTVIMPAVSPGITEIIDQIAEHNGFGDVSPGDENVCWLTADRRLIPVRSMSDDHLANTITMLTFTLKVESREAYREDGTVLAVWSRFQWAQYMEQELNRRAG